jgi:hypothetical protein
MRLVTKSDLQRQEAVTVKDVADGGAVTLHS